MTEILSQASAPGKLILLGEHTVVYGKPAIGMPISQLRVQTTIESLAEKKDEIWVDAPVVHLYKNINELPADDPIKFAIEITKNECKTPIKAGILIRINSALPIAGGMGSGAAVSCSVIRALSDYLIGKSLDTETINQMVFEIEKLHHGNPSGIDNTIITYDRPIFFQKGFPPEFIEIGKSLDFLIADTGISSRTSVMVDGVRKRFEKNQSRYEWVLNEISILAEGAKVALQTGDVPVIADAMNNNHSLLQELEVSCYSLDRLVGAAKKAGAIAAKMTGAGGGGSMIALVSNENRDAVKEALLSSGAVRVIPFTLRQG
jgi:mevalonate kinase